MKQQPLSELAVCHRERLVVCARRVLGCAEEAEDVVQEVLLKARTHALRDPEAGVGWLYAVTYRQAIDVQRRRTRRRRLLERAPLERAASVDPEAGARAAEAREALGELPDPYREAVRLRYLEGLSFGELAAHMGTLERTARTWVGRGLSRLRARLGAGGSS